MESKTYFPPWVIITIILGALLGILLAVGLACYVCRFFDKCRYFTRSDAPFNRIVFGPPRKHVRRRNYEIQMTNARREMNISEKELPNSTEYVSDSSRQRPSDNESRTLGKEIAESGLSTSDVGISNYGADISDSEEKEYQSRRQNSAHLSLPQNSQAASSHVNIQ